MKETLEIDYSINIRTNSQRKYKDYYIKLSCFKKVSLTNST